MVYDQPSFSELLGSFISPYLGAVLIISVAVCLGLLALFILHSVTIWLSTDPEIAFHKARDYAGYLSSAWNSVRVLYNGAKKVALFWVPGWNTFAKHMIEPGVNIGIDVISQVFAGHHFEGIIADEDRPGGVPFRGHYCGDVIRNPDGTVAGFADRSRTTTKYCAFQSEALWAGELGVTESDDPVNAISNGTLLLSTAHARKLQALFGEPNSDEGGSMFPALMLGPLLEAVREISGIVSMIQTTMYDIAAHVIYTILSELASVIFNIVQVLIRAVSSVIMSLVSSGALQTIIKAGIDLLMTLVVYVAIPLLMSILDLIVCIINFIQPGTWPEQMRCVEQTCFQESGDIGAEIFTTFSSLPVIAKAVVTAVEALVNPSTGRKFGEAAEGGTEVPEMGVDAHATAAAATCASCFTCKVKRLHSNPRPSIPHPLRPLEPIWYIHATYERRCPHCVLWIARPTLANALLQLASFATFGRMMVSYVATDGAAAGNYNLARRISG